MKKLSPAAQAVLDAACESLDHRGYISDQVAAALRAVVNQVIAVSTNLRQTKIRAELLAIANELDGHA